MGGRDSDLGASAFVVAVGAYTALAVIFTWALLAALVARLLVRWSWS